MQAAKCVGFNSAGNQTEAQVLKNGQAGSPRACHGADIDHAARAELCQVSLISVSCKEQKQGQRLSAAAQDQACRGCGRRRMHSASRCALHSKLPMRPAGVPTVQAPGVEFPKVWPSVGTAAALDCPPEAHPPARLTSSSTSEASSMAESRRASYGELARLCSRAATRSWLHSSVVGPSAQYRTATNWPGTLHRPRREAQAVGLDATTDGGGAACYRQSAAPRRRRPRRAPSPVMSLPPVCTRPPRTPVVVYPAPLLLHVPHLAPLQERHVVLHAQQQGAGGAVGRGLPAQLKGPAGTAGWVPCLSRAETAGSWPPKRGSDTARARSCPCRGPAK